MGDRRSRRARRRIWLLRPPGRSAAARVAWLARAALPANDTPRAGHTATRPAALGRALLALPLAALFGYGFWRAGFQVTNGLDPNVTVSACGGPTYAGALACHYLDLVMIMAAVAWLLDRVPPRPADPARRGAPVPATVGPVGYLGGNDTR